MSTDSTDLSKHLDRILELDPEASAIEFRGQWHRWRELADVARDLVRRLDEAGLPEGAAVGLVLRNDPAMIAATIALLVRKGCIVALNPHQGDLRLARDIRELALPVIVATPADWQREDVAAATRESGALGLALELGVAASEVAGCVLDRSIAHHPPLPGVAVQMLTSGTTGAPKRIALGLAALSQSLLGAAHYRRGKQSATDRTPRLVAGVALISAPLVHIGGLWRTFQCLVEGRPIALLERFEVDAWRDLVRRHRPRTASLVPAALRMLLEADVPREELTSLVSVVSGTAPLDPETAERFEAKYGIAVLTTYGATEFAGGVAGWTLDDHHRFSQAKRGSVGRAHPGCALRVVDSESGALLPPGGEGLLEVRSAQLGDGSGWVRTTDRAVLDADGFLFIRGRSDAAIVRGGFKIHPDELVKVLESHPAVAEAAVVGLPDARLGQVPVAVVSLRRGAPVPEESELRDHARRHLASYQVPARIRVIDELPRTPSMKVSLPGVLALFEQGDGSREG